MVKTPNSGYIPLFFFNPLIFFRTLGYPWTGGNLKGREKRPVVLPVFKTGGPGDKSGWWVRLPLPSARNLWQGKVKPEKTIKRAHIFVSGRVQGVFYRAHTREVASAHGLTGWVKNCYDGRVEAVLEGGHAEIEKVIQWCRKGPPAAHVTGVEVNWEEPTGEFGTFSIRY